MMNELHEMSKRMNALNLEIKDIKEDVKEWEQKQTKTYRERVAARRANLEADMKQYNQIIDDCIINLKALNGRLEYHQTAYKLMAQEFKKAARAIALNELYNHLDTHDGKRWTKRNKDKIEAVLTPLFEPLGIRCYISLNHYNFRNIDIDLYYKSERDNVTAWRVLDDSKYINAAQGERTTVVYDLQKDFYNQAANVLNAKLKIKKLKEQIRELEKTIPYCVA